MRPFCEEFQINGKPLPVPDADVTVTYRDLDADDAGLDESGYFHRRVMRRRVGSWEFSWSFVTREEYDYLQDLLAGLDVFPFRAGDTVTEAYCDGCRCAFRSAATGLYHGVRLTVKQC